MPSERPEKYFALGHSTIVVIAALVAYWTASAAQKHFEFLKDIGGIFSTGKATLEEIFTPNDRRGNDGIGQKVQAEVPHFGQNG